jgi:hypothetical protein
MAAGRGELDHGYASVVSLSWYSTGFQLTYRLRKSTWSSMYMSNGEGIFTGRDGAVEKRL